MAKQGKIVEIGLHIIGWGLLMFFNVMIIKGAGVKIDIARQIIQLTIFLLVFYSFYFLIAPLLLKKKKILFIIASVVFISGAIVTNQTIQRHYHEKIIQEVIKERRKQVGNSEGSEREIRLQRDKPPFVRRNLRFQNSALQVLFFVLVSLILRFIQKWQHDEKEKYVLEKEKSDAELQFLKQQINPHFLFNSLNSIYSLANKKSDLTTEAILKLSGILRYVLYHSEKKLVPLIDEIATIENYIELQRLRLTKKVLLNYDTKGNPENYLIEPLLLMPIFENAFKFGVDSITESFIDIHLEINSGKLYLHATNKIVPQKEKSDEDSGIGIKNIKRRLELLYPDNYILYIDQQELVFNLKLNLNLKK